MTHTAITDLAGDAPRADLRHAPVRRFWFDDEAPARSLSEERRRRQGARYAFENLYAGLVEHEPDLRD